MKLAASLAFIILIIMGIIGWFKNIFEIFGMWSEPFTAELAIRIAGVPIAIVGAIAGWF